MLSEYGHHFWAAVPMWAVVKGQRHTGPTQSTLQSEGMSELEHDQPERGGTGTGYTE